MGKKFRYSTTSIIDVLLIAGILVLLNIFSLGEFRRLDLTANKEYTISKATKNILSQLDDIVNVKVFLSSELPPQILPRERQLKDLMDEFQAYANTNFKLKFIDPKIDTKSAQEAQMAGIEPISLTVFEKDQQQTKQVYFGILIEHGNKTEAIPVAVDVENLEYNLMSRIVKVLQKENELPSIGILQGHGEPSATAPNEQTQTPPGEMYLFSEAIRQEYKAFDVKLDNRDQIPTTVNTLLVVNPGSIPDYQLYAIDQFVMRGGKMVCMVNGVTVTQNLMEPPTPAKNGVEDLLEFYGVKVNQDIVLDSNCDTARFSRGGGGFIQQKYPFWIKILKENFDQTNPATSPLETATFQWASSIDILKDRLQGVTATTLVKTSKKSWLMTKDFSIHPMQDFNVMPTGDQYNLAVLLQGNFTSYFAGKDKPINPSDNSPVGKSEPYREKSAPASIVVFSTGQLAMNHQWDPRGGSPENQKMILNTFDFLNIGSELIGIRSRQSTTRPLKQDILESVTQRNIIRFTTIFAIPVLVILIGIIRFVLKSGRKKRFENEMKAKD